MRNYLVLGILIFINFNALSAQEKKYILPPADYINIDEKKITFSTFDVICFSGPYIISEHLGYKILTVSGVDFVVFQREDWITLYPRNTLAFINLIKGWKEEGVIYIKSPQLGKSPVSEWIFGGRSNSKGQFQLDRNYSPFNFIQASSSFKEIINGIEVNYNSANLTNGDLRKPWVEGSKGRGEGEFIKLKLLENEKTNRIIIYNGFFDPHNLDLYKENCRAKMIKISTQNKEMTVLLKDSPHGQEIELGELTNSVRIDIISVYTGDLYTDCAISGIFAKSPRWCLLDAQKSK